MHTKGFNTFFKRWVQFRVGAIPRLPLMLIVFYSKCNIINTLLGAAIFLFSMLDYMHYSLRISILSAT